MLPEEYGGQAGPIAEINRKSELIVSSIDEYSTPG